MTKSLLDLSGKIDFKTIELFEIVNRISNNLGISYVVVGATARDLVCKVPVPEIAPEIAP